GTRAARTPRLAGARTRGRGARRACGTRPISCSSATRARGPEMRTTAIAAGGRPEERAKMVSRTLAILRIRIVRRLLAWERRTRLHGAAADHPPMIVWFTR